jgi:hypothetical protein
MNIMKTNQLSFDRLGLMFQRYFMENFRKEIIYWSIMVILFMFLRNFTVGMMIMIFVAGVFYPAIFFKEIHSRKNGAAYFMIPASQLEKMIVGVVMTVFYYFAMMMIAYVIGNLLGTFLNNMLASMNLFFINMFHYSPLQWVLFTNVFSKYMNGQPVIEYAGLFEVLKAFLISQSIYLLGSIYFKNNQTFKTFFAIIGILIIFTFLMFIEVRLFIGGNGLNVMGLHSPDDYKMIALNILHVFKYLFVPYLWVVSYFRLTEKQV